MSLLKFDPARVVRDPRGRFAHAGQGVPLEERRSLTRGESWQRIGSKLHELPPEYTGESTPELPVGSFTQFDMRWQMPKAVTPEQHGALLRGLIHLIRQDRMAAIVRADKQKLFPPGTDRRSVNQAYNLASMLALHDFGVGVFDHAMDDELKARMTPLQPAIRYFRRRISSQMLGEHKGAWLPYRQEFGVPFKEPKFVRYQSRLGPPGTERLRVPPRQQLIKIMALPIDGGLADLAKLRPDIAQSYPRLEKFILPLLEAGGEALAEWGPAVLSAARNVIGFGARAAAQGARAAAPVVGRAASAAGEGIAAGYRAAAPAVGRAASAAGEKIAAGYRAAGPAVGRAASAAARYAGQAIRNPGQAWADAGDWATTHSTETRAAGWAGRKVGGIFGQTVGRHAARAAALGMVGATLGSDVAFYGNAARLALGGLGGSRQRTTNPNANPGQQPAINPKTGQPDPNGWRSKRLEVARDESQGDIDRKPLTQAQKMERIRAARTYRMDRQQNTQLTQPGQPGSLSNFDLKRDPGINNKPPSGMRLGKSFPRLVGAMVPPSHQGLLSTGRLPTISPHVAAVLPEAEAVLTGVRRAPMLRNTRFRNNMGIFSRAALD